MYANDILDLKILSLNLNYKKLQVEFVLFWSVIVEP